MSVLKELIKLLPLIHLLHYTWILLSTILQLSLRLRPPTTEDFLLGGRIQPFLLICSQNLVSTEKAILPPISHSLQFPAIHENDYMSSDHRDSCSLFIF